MECLPKVVSDFVGEQLRVHIMPISAKWKHKSSIHIGFIVFNGGVTTFFAKSVHESAASNCDATMTDCSQVFFMDAFLSQWPREMHTARIMALIISGAVAGQYENYAQVWY